MKQAKVLIIPTLIGCVALANAQSGVITSALTLNSLGFQDSKKSSDQGSSGGDRQKVNRNDRGSDRNTRSRGGSDRGGSDRGGLDRGGLDRGGRGGQPDRIRPDQNVSGRDYGRPSGGNGGGWGWGGSGSGHGNSGGNSNGGGRGNGGSRNDREYDHGNGRGGNSNVIIIGGSSGRPFGRPSGTPNCYRGGGFYLGLNWHFADEPRRVNGFDCDDNYDFEISHCGRTLNYNWDERPYRLNGVVMVAFNRTALQLRGVENERDRDGRLVYLYKDRDVLVHREGSDEFRLNGRIQCMGERSEDRHGTYYVPLNMFSALLGSDLRVRICN